MTRRDTIWRIENRQGFGPFFTRPEKEWRIKRLSLVCPERPYFLADGISNMPSHYFFGCSSHAQLQHWFLSVQDVLATLGFRIRVYRVHRFRIEYGRTQVAFDKAGALLLRDFPCSLLHRRELASIISRAQASECLAEAGT